MVLETLIFSLIISVAVGLAAGYLGSLMVLEKMALVGDALSHVALPGLALGLLYGFNEFLGAFAFLFVSAILIWHVGRVTKLSFETIVGAAFTLALAIGVLLFGDNVEALSEALFGDITKVALIDTVAAVIIAIFAILLTRVVYRQLVLGMISEDIAISKGINLARIDLLYLLLVSVVVAVGIRIVGTLLAGFLVIVPAASAKNLSFSLHKYILLSSIFGAISAFSGVLLANYLNTPIAPAGPLVVIVGIAIFAATIFARWRRK